MSPVLSLVQIFLQELILLLRQWSPTCSTNLQGNEQQGSTELRKRQKLTCTEVFLLWPSKLGANFWHFLVLWKWPLHHDWIKWEIYGTPRGVARVAFGFMVVKQKSTSKDDSTYSRCGASCPRGSRYLIVKVRSCEFLRVIGLNFNEFQLCNHQAVIHIHSLMVPIPIFTETSPSMGHTLRFLGLPPCPKINGGAKRQMASKWKDFRSKCFLMVHEECRVRYIACFGCMIDLKLELLELLQPKLANLS